MQAKIKKVNKMFILSPQKCVLASVNKYFHESKCSTSLGFGTEQFPLSGMLNLAQKKPENDKYKGPTLQQNHRLKKCRKNA